MPGIHGAGPHINIPEEMPGIVGLTALYPETERPLHGPPNRRGEDQNIYIDIGADLADPGCLYSIRRLENAGGHGERSTGLPAEGR